MTDHPKHPGHPAYRELGEYQGSRYTAPDSAAAGGSCLNTDREIYRSPAGSMYDDSIHVTEGGGIGLNVGGYVIVKPLRDWHNLVRVSQVEELRACRQRIDELMNMLTACREWFHNRADVAGTTPSSEMEMLKAIDVTFLEPFPAPQSDEVKP